MNRKLFLASLAAAVALPAMVTPVHTGAATPMFKDVPKTSQYYKEITAMSGEGIIYGYTDGYFRPDQKITKRHAAALVSRAKGNKLPKNVALMPFKDVPKTHTNYNDIMKLQQAGVFTADSKGNFNPEKELTRAEMAKVLVIAFDLQVKADYAFPDVPENHIHAEYVKALYSNDITTGNNGKFLPNQSLTRAHYAVFMYRALNSDKPLKQTPTLPAVRPIPEPETPFKPSGLVPRSEEVKKPAGWTPAIYDQHMKKIEETVFKYSPKKGTGVQFGKGGFGLYELDDPSFISMNKEQLKAIGSKSTIEEWIAGINYALETGDVYIAADNSYALYAQYSKSDTNGAAIIYIR